MPNKNLVGYEIDPRNQPALVAADVKDGTRANAVRVRIDLPHVRQVSPFGVLCYREPRLQRFFPIWVFLPSFFERLSANDPQAESSHIAKFLSNSNFLLYSPAADLDNLEADVERPFARDPLLTQKHRGTNQAQMPPSVQ
jgi:hypothetical protein